MPNRVIRDWTTSEAMDSISFEAEVFFTRLIMKADDYGSYYSNPKLLKAALFPLKEVSFQQIGKWVFECTEAGLIFPYEVEGKEYIRIQNFKQRLRNMRNSFPHPLAANSPQVAANSLPTRRESPPEYETETETKQKQKQKQNTNTCAVVDDGIVSRGTDFTPMTDEWFKSIFDDLHLEQKSMTYRDHDVKDQFEKFKSKVRGSPGDYIHRDGDGMRKAFDYQLRTTKPQRKYATPQRTLTETSPNPGKDYSEKF